MDIKMNQCADSEDRIRSGSSHQDLHCLSSVNGSLKEITWQSEWTCLNSRKDKSILRSDSDCSPELLIRGNIW